MNNFLTRKRSFLDGSQPLSLLFSPIYSDRQQIVFRHILTKSFGVRNRQDAYTVGSLVPLIFGKRIGGLHLSVLVWAQFIMDLPDEFTPYG